MLLRFFFAGFLLLSGHAQAAELRTVGNLCNFQISAQYWAEKSCRTGDVVTGSEMADGLLKVKCGRPIVLCNLASESNPSKAGTKAGNDVAEQALIPQAVESAPDNLPQSFN